ncbi:MAG: SLBB domain-containing protein [Bacteroidales bacterium]|nr:SLBB domain-containing protein [Bacteroidales bacterium]
MKKILFIYLIAICSIATHAQSLSLLKSMNIDNIDDSQIEQLMSKMQSEGVSVNQIDKYASAQGMKQDDIAKLKKRIVKYNNEKGGVKKRKSTELLNTEKSNSFVDEKGKALEMDSEMQRYYDAYFSKLDSIKSAKLKVFGSEIFKDVNLSFEPNLRLATPTNYILGPDDELLIDVYGMSEISQKVFVSPEGNIRIPNVGLVTVGGLSIDEAKKVITAKLSKIYGGINSKNTFVSIALGDIRSITVTVIGEVVYPGSYTIPSLATVFNALYQSGGPKENGSFREVQVIRNSKVIATVDLYDFIVFGKQTNLRLQDQDAIKVLPYRNRVTLSGEVKTPAIFEMKVGETLSSLLEFAGGFSDKAYRERITANRNTLKEKCVVDVAHTDYKVFKTEAGDEYLVGKLLNRFENRVQITGSIYRPGAYALTSGMTAADLIRKAEGLRENAFTSRALIFRKSDSGLPQMSSFSPKNVLSGKESLQLQREDSIVISSVLDMKEEDFVYLSGEVVTPDKYPFAEGMSLKDLLLLGNGVKSKANINEIEVFRQISDEKLLNDNVVKAESYKINVNRDLAMNDKASSFKLQREDRVIVRPIFGYEEAKEVSIDGEVRAPGVYILMSKNQKISDLVYKAGGVTSYAYLSGAFLIRKLEKKETEKKLLTQVANNLSSKLKKQSESADSVKVKKELMAESDIVGINLEKILKQPGSEYDLKLEAGDELYIPKYLETVKVTGEVLRPNTVRYDKRLSFTDYVDASGGYGSNALIKRSYIIQANGSVQTVKSFLWFKHYPKVKPGSRIVIPEEAEKKGMTTAETISVTSSIVSVAAIIVTLFKY